MRRWWSADECPWLMQTASTTGMNDESRAHSYWQAIERKSDDVLSLHIERSTGGYRIGRGDCPADIYDEVRSTVLQANIVLVQRLLHTIPPRQWSIPDTELSA
jgi:hypothetical protein